MRHPPFTWRLAGAGTLDALEDVGRRAPATLVRMTTGCGGRRGRLPAPGGPASSPPTRPPRARRVDPWPLAWALVFSPFVLVGLSLAVTDLVQVAATGQPLSSSEGLVGLLAAGTLLALLGVGVARTPAPLVAFAGWASVVGVLQTVPADVPLVVVRTTWRGSAAAMGWCLFPACVWTIAVGGAAAAVLAHRARRGRARGTPAPDRVANANILISVLLAATADAALLWTAPRDTTAVAARGLAGLAADSAARPVGLVAAAALGAIAVLSYRSSMGAQIAAWAVMVVPSLVVVPLVSSFSGWVATPGASLATAVGLASPVITGLGLMLAGTSLAVHWARGTTLRRASAG